MRKKKIKLYYWKAPNGKPNFGDELGPEICQKLFSFLDIVYESNIRKADLLTVGSLLHILLDLEAEFPIKRVNIWGSGTIYPLQAQVGSINGAYPLHEFSNLNLSKLKFYAVRGKLTQKDLKLSNLTLGDPGILANLAYERSAKQENIIGIIPHFEDANKEIVRKLAMDNHFKIIDVLRSPQEVITDITSCKLVFSSSLHGLIVSDSFGVPNVHLNLSNQLVGGAFKFDDYYSGVDKVHELADISKITNLEYQENLINNYQPIQELKEKQLRLLNAFPYKKRNFIYSVLAKIRLVS